MLRYSWVAERLAPSKEGLSPRELVIFMKQNQANARLVKRLLGLYSVERYIYYLVRKRPSLIAPLSRWILPTAYHPFQYCAPTYVKVPTLFLFRRASGHIFHLSAFPTLFIPLPLCHHRHNMWRKIQIMNLHIMKFSSAACYFGGTR
jgi:hypothetical protein